MSATPPKASPPAPAAKKTLTLRDHLASAEFQRAVTEALPKHLTPERQIRIALTAMTRSPTLAQCDAASFLRELLRLSSFGLEPDGYNAHLVPFWNKHRGCYEAVAMIDYKGSAALVMRSGLVSHIFADKVCKKDDFSWNKGQVERHLIDYSQDRGPAYAYYCIVTFKDGTTRAECLARGEIDAVRARSKTPENGPWVTDYDEMAKKTVFKRMCKWLPISSEVRELMDSDSEFDDDRSVRAAVPLHSSHLMHRAAESFLPPIAEMDSRAGKSEPSTQDVQPEGGDTTDIRSPDEQEAALNAVPLQDPAASSKTPGAGPVLIPGSPQARLAEWLNNRGYTFDELQAYAIANRWANFDAYGTVEELPAAFAQRFMAGSKGLAAALDNLRTVKAKAEQSNPLPP